MPALIIVVFWVELPLLGTVKKLLLVKVTLSVINEVPIWLVPVVVIFVNVSLFVNANAFQSAELYGLSNSS